MRQSFIVLLALILFGGACRKDPNFDQLSSNFVVVTNVDQNANFANYKTFYISDTLTYLSNTSTDTILFDNNAKQIVAAIKQNMAARGFTFVPKSAQPDLGINAGIVKNTNAGYVYPGWWGGYPGWWDPWYWGWPSYPYYYPWTVAYVITSGSVIVDIVDLKNAARTKIIDVLWSDVSSGALGSDINGNLQRGINSINQAFAQSPYIKTN
ncbi:DUF4136 domain-containing protein [Chitinophagaceae bacterium LWZ2-11]